MALSITAAAAPASAALHKEAYNADWGFGCPVKTIVDGSYTYADGDTRKFRVDTSITLGPNNYIFANCSAQVFVDVLADNGDRLASLNFYHWTGPLSSNQTRFVRDVYLPKHLPAASDIQIRQYPS
jgi:hypothetical protein